MYDEKHAFQTGIRMSRHCKMLYVKIVTVEDSHCAKIEQNWRNFGVIPKGCRMLQKKRLSDVARCGCHNVTRIPKGFRTFFRNEPM